MDFISEIAYHVGFIKGKIYSNKNKENEIILNSIDDHLKEIYINLFKLKK